MIAVVFKLPTSKVYAVFHKTAAAAERDARLARYWGATFAAVVLGNGKAVERIRKGGLHGIGEVEIYAGEEH
jgi:hypothetical protein